LAYCAVAQDNDVETLTTTAPTEKPSKPSKDKPMPITPLLPPPPITLPGAVYYSDPFFPVVRFFFVNNLF